MDLDKETIRLIKAVVHETQNISPKTKANEFLLQSGITFVGLFILGLIISALCWGIVFIWNNIL